jgi:hypothetical protein
MNPYERRVIHSALQDSEIVTTESAGEEPNRYVVITPKNFRSNADGRAQGNGGRVFNRDKKYGGYDNRERGGGRGYNGGFRKSGYGGAEKRSADGGERSYNNRERGNYASGAGRSYSDGGERGYNNREHSNYADGAGRSYSDGGERGYNSRERGGYASGAKSPADGVEREYGARPDYYEDGAESLTEKTENVQRETLTENEKDYSEVNNNFSSNFKKNGTKNFKSFGYKRR